MAHRLTHGLKGNAGFFGLTLLQQAAMAVEQNLRDEKNLVTEEQFKTLEIEMNAVLSQFMAELKKSDGDLSESVLVQGLLNDESTQQLIEKLELMLNMGKPACRDLIESLSRLPHSEKLIKQIEDLDFEPAIVTLAELKEKWKT